MRHSELSEGISVLDDSGSVVGTSKVAARHVGSLSFTWWIPQICYFTLLALLKQNFPFFYVQIVTLKAFFSLLGSSRNSSDQSGHAHAHPGAAPHRHECSGKVRRLILWSISLIIYCGFSLKAFKKCYFTSLMEREQLSVHSKWISVAERF